MDVLRPLYPYKLPTDQLVFGGKVSIKSLNINY